MRDPGIRLPRDPVYKYFYWKCWIQKDQYQWRHMQMRGREIRVLHQTMWPVLDSLESSSTLELDNRSMSSVKVNYFLTPEFYFCHIQERKDVIRTFYACLWKDRAIEFWARWKTYDGRGVCGRGLWRIIVRWGEGKGILSVIKTLW